MHSDGRMYHSYLTPLVLEMLRARRHHTERQKKWIAKQAIEKSALTRQSRVIDASDVDVTTKNKSSTVERTDRVIHNDASMPGKLPEGQKRIEDRKPRPGESTADFVARMAQEVAARKAPKP